MDVHIFHLVYRQNMHVGLWIPSVTPPPQGSGVHKWEPAGPIHLKLVLFANSNMCDGDVLQKYLF